MRKLLTTVFYFLLPLILVIIFVMVGYRIALNRDSYFKISPAVHTLVLGHSQTECAINDSLIKHTRNMSQGGESYFYTYLKLKKLLQANKQVQTVLLSFANNQIHERMDTWIWGNENIYNAYPKYAFLCEFEQYRLLLKNNFSAVLKAENKFIKNTTAFFIKRKTNYLAAAGWGGYLYLKRDKIDSLLQTDYLEKEGRFNVNKQSQMNLFYLEKIVSLCREKKVALFLVRMPVDHRLPFLKNEHVYQQIKVERFGSTPLLDFSRVPLSKGAFGDFDHLNYKGAREFSLFLDVMLRKGLLQETNPQVVINQSISTSAKRVN